jgi:hypothetical protein
MSKSGIEGHPQGMFLRDGDRVGIDAAGIGARSNEPGACQWKQQFFHAREYGATERLP